MATRNSKNGWNNSSAGHETLSQPRPCRRRTRPISALCRRSAACIASASTSDPQEYLAALDKLRWTKLKRQIPYVFSNEDYYRPIFLEAGVRSPEDVQSFDEFRRLPNFIDKNRHR